MIGIDFGTSTTLVASGSGLINIGKGIEESMPSLLGYGSGGSLLLGEEAAELPPSQVIRSVKRAITERRDFVVVDTPNGLRDVRVDDLVGHLLHEAVRRGAGHGLSLAVPGAVRLGCPAMWDGRARRRLLDAAARAGLSVSLEHLVEEPVAAGIAWLAAQPARLEARATRVLVFDMGGGTLDVAVLEVRGPGNREIAVLAALGVPEAGDALDDVIADDLDIALARDGVDTEALPSPDRARELLLDAARRVKVRLSTEEEAPVPLLRETFGVTDLWYTRERLTAVFGRQLERAEQYVAAALRVAHLTQQAGRSARDIARLPLPELAAAVDVVLLSGGMSRVPAVAERLRGLFPATTRIEPAADNPAHAVALGLARTDGYGRLNLYRPAFDLVLEWEDGRRRRTLYEAFTPLVEQTQIVRGSADLRFLRTGAELALPRTGTGTLRLHSYGDPPARASIEGEKLDGFAVRFGELFELSLYPNGAVRVVDAAGRHEGQIEDWLVRG